MAVLHGRRGGSRKSDSAIQQSKLLDRYAGTRFRSRICCTRWHQALHSPGQRHDRTRPGTQRAGDRPRRRSHRHAALFPRVCVFSRQRWRDASLRRGGPRLPEHNRRHGGGGPHQKHQGNPPRPSRRLALRHGGHHEPGRGE